MIGMFGLAAVGLMAMSQGCSSSTTPTGGTGGGAGGANGDAATDGGVVKITTALLTDFTAGSTGGPLGAVFLFHDTGLSDATIDVTGGNLKATFDTGVPSTMYPYVGWGLPFNAVSDLTAFTGIKFTISGTLGAGCSAIQFALGDVDHSSSPPFGVCTGSCYPGSKTIAVTATPTDITTLFTDLPTGGPATAAEPAKATGIQWQLQFLPGDAAGTCVGNITIDNITLVP
jgi:hypothetical protein